MEPINETKDEMNEKFLSEQAKMESIFDDLTSMYDDEIRNIREDEFIRYFLPLFSMSPDELDKQLPLNNVTLLHWVMHVSRGVNFPVNIVNANNEIVAIVPPLTDNTSHRFDKTNLDIVVDNETGLHNRLANVFNYCQQIKDAYPAKANALSEAVLEGRSRLADNKEYVMKWYKLFNHYGIIKDDKKIQIDTSVSNPSETQHSISDEELEDW